MIETSQGKGFYLQGFFQVLKTLCRLILSPSLFLALSLLLSKLKAFYFSPTHLHSVTQ